MKEKGRGPQTDFSAEEQINQLLSRFDPDRQEILKSARHFLQARFPGVYELVYDYSRSVVIAFAPSERGSDALVSLASDSKSLRLVFTQGAQLPDPDKLLQGKASQIRFIELEQSNMLHLPAVEKLLMAAESAAQFIPSGDGSKGIILKPSKKK